MEEVKIIFKNDNYFVINKPAGLVTTNENGREITSLERWLFEKYGDVGLRRQGIAHRLDKGTSGIVLVARNQQYLDYFLKIFKDRKVFKKYIALVTGEASFKGSIDMPIGRNGHIFGKFGVRSEGKNALTLFERIATIVFEEKKFSLIKVDLKTGRTHQIRVHFAYLGWPLVGDKIYGGKVVANLDRPFLHSSEIEFVDMEGNHVYYRSKLSKDLTKTLKIMGYEKNILV
ncbi:MAG: RNA pseudouridine synthase [Candidatus Shapirobacteria bacterium]